MTTTTIALAGLKAQVEAMVADLLQPSGLFNIKVGNEWPAQEGLSRVTQCQHSLITVYDRKMAQDVTRWLTVQKRKTDGVLGIAATMSNETIAPGATETITIGYADGQTAVHVEDAIMANLRVDLTTQDGAVAIAVAGETLTTLAAKLAASINARTPMTSWVNATSVGAVVSITNVTSQAIQLSGECGNIQTVDYEQGRTKRYMQIVLWTKDTATRDAISDRIEVALSALERAYGFELASTEQVQVKKEGDFFDSTDAKAGVYRRDFFIAIEYAITSVDFAYPTLHSNTAFTSA